MGTSLGENGTVVVREAPSAPSAPVVDADGGIVYAAYTGTGVLTLYKVPARASKPTVLGEGGGAGFTTTPDGRFIVFSSSPESPMYRVNNDGTGLMKLVDRNAGGPTITPDGKAVLFSPFGSLGLYSVPIEGGTVRELTKLFVGGAPSVSPDGRRLLIAGGKPSVSILCDLPDCTNVTELELKSPKWAPDGRGVAYINDEDHGNLWEQPLDGGPPRALTHFDVAEILEFAWSPDYKRLVLSRGRMSDDLVLLKGLR
jgi:Tol biopolymer transport system component